MSATAPRAAIGPRVVAAVARLLLRVFYRRIDVVGLERVPRAGPLVVVANHTNALVDPMLILATIPRPLVPLAKAPLFRNPLVAPFLKLAGAIPVHRRQDAGSGPADNRAMFASATAALGRNAGILLFPEGVSQPEPVLMPLRTGAARIVLGCPPDVAAATTLLPVGLVFHEPGRFRAGWGLVMIGPPVETADCVALYRAEPEDAVRRLTDRIAEALRAVMVEVGDRATLRLVEVAEAIWLAESPAGARDPRARAEWRRRAAAVYRYLQAREPARLEALRLELERYAGDLEDSGLSQAQLDGPASPRAAVRYAAVQGLALAIGLPAALLGIAIHALPYWSTALAVRVARPDPDMEATFKLGAGVVLYPLAWLAEAWLVWRSFGAIAAAGFALAVLPAGFFALSWSDRLASVVRDARAWFRVMADRDLRRHLAARRHALMRELAALEAMIPAAALADRAEHTA